MTSHSNKTTRRSGLLGAIIVCGGFLIPTTVSAQSLMGPYPYDFPARSGQAALILYESNKTASASGSGGDTTLYSSTTISATNWQQIEMTLGDGSEASMVTDSSQSSEGGTTTSNSEFFNNTLEEELIE
ncbi:hypothetical protein [Modicisalibacter muralis]|uniref:hypothetical protein n=1 Tax=Modicisalibacter muralis TaxID=119000 RepID=UPI000B7EE454|nr:hypothetical protein [Halomonas muralis]